MDFIWNIAGFFDFEIGYKLISLLLLSFNLWNQSHKVFDDNFISCHV